MRETDTHIYFFSRGDSFSNFAKVPFIYEKKIDDVFGKKVEKIYFECSEQAYMMEKCLFFGQTEMAKQCVEITDENWETRIPDPREVKKIGRSIPNFDAEKWGIVSYKKMYDVLMAKFTYNEKAKKQLIDSGSKILVEASIWDKLWGCGLSQEDDNILFEENWTGENRLGKVLMRVRKDIRK